MFCVEFEILSSNFKYHFAKKLISVSLFEKTSEPVSNVSQSQQELKNSKKFYLYLFYINSSSLSLIF